MAGQSVLRYGGNTLCVEVRLDDGTLLVLDCGGGAPSLGGALLASGQKPLIGHILLTHTHWDHIQGFPFFVPLFIPGNQWDIYGPAGLGGSGSGVQEVLAGQMDYTYFPVQLGMLGATLRFHDLVERTYQIGGARVTAQYLNHSTLTLGYRIEAGGRSVVYVTDHEPFAGPMLLPPNGTYLGEPDSLPAVLAAHGEERRHVRFMAGADLVIHDAQYTLAEYPTKVGWGHSPVEYVVDAAVAAGVKQLALFHHDPIRNDDLLAALEESCLERAAAAGSRLEVFASREGQVVDLPESASTTVSGGSTARASEPPVPAQPATGNGHANGSAVRSGAMPTVLVIGRAGAPGTGPDVAEQVRKALQPEGVRLVTASRTEDALSAVRDEGPTLILLEHVVGDQEALDTLRALRDGGTAGQASVPVVLVGPTASADAVHTAFEAGAADFLAQPLVPAVLRARVRGWLLRVRATVPEVVDGGS